MSSEFQVDADGPASSPATCTQLANEIDERNLPRNEIAGVAGAAKVERAYNGFIAHQSDGLLKARGHLEEMGKRLESAGLAYCDTDGAVSQGGRRRLMSTSVAYVLGPEGGAGSSEAIRRASRASTT